ncbi:glycosyltransferase [Winogradskyella sp.]|nr:glycosyltransferase [Winogradskyella sp.]
MVGFKFSMQNQTLIISPSGQYYGSEQMLHEHLLYTDKEFKVYVNSNGNYLQILKKNRMIHQILEFSNVKILYIKIFFLLVFNNYSSVYVNEGGHIKYIKQLAKYFTKKKFIVHIRLFEDTKHQRLNNHLLPNMQLICVSDFIKNEIHKENIDILNTQVETVHDYYLTHHITPKKTNVSNTVRIGILGRVSSAKGVLKACELLQYWDSNVSKDLECYMYGDIIEDEDVKTFVRVTKSFSNIKVFFKGFVSDKEQFFKTFDIVIHFNAYEPFPRIYFDAMARLKPVVGFDSGGIGEQARIFGFQKNLVPLTKDWASKMCDTIISIHNNMNKQQEDILKKQYIFQSRLNIGAYINSIEKYF